MQKIDFIFSTNPIHYDFATKFMCDKVERIIAKKENQAIWLLEHPSVYTIGRSASTRDIRSKVNIPFVNTDRGGGITYHGPGQKIIYIMLNLKQLFNNQLDLSLFVRMLESWIISILAQNNIVAYSDMQDIGIWVTNNQVKKKIAFLGIKIKKWISYHGVAINVHPNINFFRNIIPCGIDNCPMTSIYLENKRYVQDSVFNDMIKDCFFKIFNLQLDKIYQI